VSERFLIVRLGALGDVVHGIPTAAALRRHFPAARIDWLVEPRYVQLLGLVTAVNRVVPCDPRDGMSRLLQAVRELRRSGYDAAFDLQGLLKSAVLARSAGARMTVGAVRQQLREPLARAFYTRSIETGPQRHVVFKGLALLESVGVRDDRVEFPLRETHSAAAAEVRRVTGGGYALLNPGAAWPNKRWPAVRFGAVAAAMQARFGWRSVVLWGPGEEALAASVIAASAGSGVLAPPTSISDLVAIARGARLMLSGDTGPLHIAGAAGTPLVALFGPTNPARNGPWAVDDIALSRVDACACVYERRCRRATPCIDDIGVDEVIAAIEQRVRGRG
jgi:heptosyltransferase I